jgi:hypothetical protein
LSWLIDAREDLRAEGFWPFWFDWRIGMPELREAAYEHGRFTEWGLAQLGRYLLVQVPAGAAWTAAALAVALVPRWLPRAGALPRTPWVGAACLHPLPVIAGVRAAMTPEVVAHELAHVIWPRLPAALRGQFPCVLAELEERDPELRRWLDRCMAGYKDPRSPDECHVRLLEYFRYGREAMPAVAQPFYENWIRLPQ